MTIMATATMTDTISERVRHGHGATEVAADGPERVTGLSNGVVSHSDPSGEVQNLTIHDFPSTALARALSPNGRTHWRDKHNLTIGIHQIVKVVSDLQHIRPVAGPVAITLRYVYPVARSRDLDNATGGVSKATIDGLVRSKILADDSSGHVVSVHAEIVVEKGQRRLEVVIEPVEIDR